MSGVGAAQAAAWLPPVYEGGGGPTGCPHLPGQVRGDQAGHRGRTQGDPPSRHDQDAVQPGNTFLVQPCKDLTQPYAVRPRPSSTLK